MRDADAIRLHKSEEREPWDPFSWELGMTSGENQSAATALARTVPVTADNFIRAESDMYFASTVKLAGGLGKFDHHREVMSIEKQTVINANGDTLYSAAVFDLDAGEVTISLPDAGKRFMSMIVIDEDQYALAVFYGAGAHALTKERVGTRYVLAGIRTFVDPGNPTDLEQVHALQDAIKVRQASPGSFEVPNWDQTSQKKVRDALLSLAATLPDTKRMFGARDEVDPVRHLIGTATGWGGNPEKDASFVTVVPIKNDENRRTQLVNSITQKWALLVVLSTSPLFILFAYRGEPARGGAAWVSSMMIALAARCLWDLRDH